MLARALYETDNLIIWKFPNEKEDFFEQFAKQVVSTEKELEEAYKKIDVNKDSNNMRSKMEKVYWLNPRGAIRSAAEMINQYLETGKII